jgi:23S rRNA (adenine2503-C2)-methyltransferase
VSVRAAPSPYEVSDEELAAACGPGPAYRVRQVRSALDQGRAIEEMTELPKEQRTRLADAFPPLLRILREQSADRGTTRKWALELDDGAVIETVFMRYRRRATVCVSSQAGCAMGCTFCATGQAGFTRHLRAGEIVEQVLLAQRAARPGRLSNVVFMGMGEPLANYDALWTAIEVLHGRLGFSARHLTVSTVGVVPGIRRLAGEALPVSLAVSLHAANDELRNELVPINRRYPLAELAAACEDYRTRRARRISFEWALIDGVNDRPSDAAELADYARALGAHVNLIALNPTPGYAVRGSSPAAVQMFAQRLGALGVNATIRATRGSAIDAACGQLAAPRGPAALGLE